MREWAEATVAAGSGSKVIFEGRVERQEPIAIDIIDLVNDPHAEKRLQRTVFFAATKTYRGFAQQSLKVTTGWGGGDCGFNFITGKEYLVYASQEDQGTLYTGICSATKLLEDASPELRVLRGEPSSPEDLLTYEAYYKRLSPKTTTSLCGRVTNTSGSPLNKASVKLIAIREEPFPSESDETKSDKNGTFCFKGINSGKFLLNAEVDDENEPTLKGFYPGVNKRSDASAVQVEAGQKLSGLNFVLPEETVQTVRFRVVNAINQPMPNKLQLMLIDSLNPAEAEYHETSPVDADGTAIFESVPEGHYFATVFLEPDDQDSEKILKHFRWKPIREEFDVNGEMPEMVLTLIPRD